MRRENLADDVAGFLTFFNHPDDVAIPEGPSRHTRRRLVLPIYYRTGGDEQKYADQPPITLHNTSTTRQAGVRDFSNGHAAKFG